MVPAGDPRDLFARKASVRLIASTEHAKTPPVVELEGEFDLDTVPEIDRFLRRNLGPLYHQEHLVIDLAAATFIDSSFVAFVMRLSGDQHCRGKELVLTRPTGQVRRVLGLVGLANVLPVYDSVDEAVGQIGAGRLPLIPPAFEAFDTARA